MNRKMNDIQVRIKKYLLNNEKCESFAFSNDTNIEFLAQGEYNINFVIKNNNEKYVFRINTGSQLNLDNQIEYEYNAIKGLEKSGVTPLGYFVDNSRQHFDEGVLMMNFLEGKPLDYKKDLIKAGEIFSNIHSLDIKDFEDLLIKEKSLCMDRVIEGERWLEAFMKSNLPLKETKKILGNLLNYCKKELVRDKYFLENPWLVVNNTEVNSHNFIIGKKKSFLIDWEKPVISDPVQDITQFLAPTTTLWKADYILSEDQIKMFYKSYMKDQSQKYDIEERVELYKPYLYLRALSWCASAWLEYRDESRAIINKDTFEKIKMYLEPGFMENLLKAYTA